MQVPRRAVKSSRLTDKRGEDGAAVSGSATHCPKSGRFAALQIKEHSP
jgi:hypothetical protein